MTAPDVERMTRELVDWVAIPSVAGDPQYRAHLARSASYLVERCLGAGADRAEVWPQGESVAVFAEWRAQAADGAASADAPIVLVYSHHDVRATTGERWMRTEPFDPVVEDGRVHGRGASDAKGQVVAHLEVLRLHTERGPVPVTVRLLVEGEEELGSPNLAALLEEHADDISADLVVVSDNQLLDAEHPAICMGVRGMLPATLVVHGPDRDLHSGAVSGATRNPVHDLVAILAELHDADGALALPGLLDRVTTPDERERREYAALPFDEAHWHRLASVPDDAGEPGYTVPERLWARPALEVITVAGGDVVGLPRAVIPATARAELSIRIVPDLTPETTEAALRAWVEGQRARRGIRCELEVSRTTAQPPYRTPPDHPAVDALARAMAAAWNTTAEAVGRMGGGGGGPVPLLAERAGAPVVFFGTGLVEDRWHAADESARLDVLAKGAATLHRFWNEVEPALRGEPVAATPGADRRQAPADGSGPGIPS